MKSGMKKAILCIAVVLCLLLSLAVSVGWFSRDNIQNITQDRKTFEYGVYGLAMQGWTATAHGYLSVERDPTVEIVRESVDPVANLRLDGKLGKEITSVTVFYTDAVGEPFSAEMLGGILLVLPVVVEQGDFPSVQPIGTLGSIVAFLLSTLD